jgi:hypothetical protein
MIISERVVPTSALTIRSMAMKVGEGVGQVCARHDKSEHGGAERVDPSGHRDRRAYPRGQSAAAHEDRRAGRKERMWQALNCEG